MIRVFLVDDQHLFRAGLRMILAHEPDMDVVGEVDTSYQAVRAASEMAPDVVLMDISVPSDAIAATQAIGEVSVATRVLIYTSRIDRRVMLKALEAGAAGYLHQNLSPGDLITAIRAVHRAGLGAGPTATMSGLRELYTRNTRTPISMAAMRHGLTPRELDVLGALTNGLKDEEIARRLGLSEGTVRAHLRTIYQRLHVHNRREAVAVAVEEDLLGPRVRSEVSE